MRNALTPFPCLRCQQRLCVCVCFAYRFIRCREININLFPFKILENTFCGWTLSGFGAATFCVEMSKHVKTPFTNYTSIIPESVHSHSPVRGLLVWTDTQSKTYVYGCCFCVANKKLRITTGTILCIVALKHFFVILNAQMEMYEKWQVTHRYSHLKPFYVYVGKARNFLHSSKNYFNFVFEANGLFALQNHNARSICTKFTTAFSKSYRINFIMLGIFGSENG